MTKPIVLSLGTKPKEGNHQIVVSLKVYVSAPKTTHKSTVNYDVPKHN